MKKKITHKVGALPLIFFAVGFFSYGQENNILYNEGDFFVSGQTNVLTVGPFENSTKGFFINDGSVYFQSDFKNNGIYDFSKGQKSSYAYFEQGDLGKKGINIEGGNNPTSFLNVTFDTKRIDLENAIGISGSSVFESGHVYVSSQGEGAITFLEGSRITSVSDDSHVVGRVDREGRDELSLPVGNGTYHRPIILGSAQHEKDLYNSVYKSENPLSIHPHDFNNHIMEINDKEYWEVDNKSKTGFVVVELGWHEKTTSPKILEQLDKGLHIVRWDETTKSWLDESGEVDMVKKTIRTVSEVKAKGIFTLGLVDATYYDEVKIYNAVSPNGDGNNDYFIIKNINKYPNNTVQIVNRWGAKVFETNNYDSNGDGSTNVFKGEAEGRGVIGKGKLPSGTYYYIVKYEKKNGNGSEWIKKSGYLHLENN